MFFGRRKRFIKLTAKSLDRHIADFTKSMAKDFDEFIKHLKEEHNIIVPIEDVDKLEISTGTRE